MEGATCLIAAGHALLHIEKHRTQIETVFQRHNIKKSQYDARAGFNESCIRDGLGFLQQIYIFTTLSTILATSSLLTELGKILSPFSSVIFTEESSFPLPVYKIDGTIWDWDDFVFKTASKYINRGSTAAMCPTIISYSQTTNDKGDQMDSGAGDGDRENVRKEDSKGSRDKGKERDRDNHDNSGDTPRDGDHDSGHPGNSGDRLNEGSGDPDPEGMATDSPNIMFHITSKIYTNDNLSEPLQEINTVGNLTMRVRSHAILTQNLIKCCIDG